jgi:uncharacterized protein YkwD
MLLPFAAAGAAVMLLASGCTPELHAEIVVYDGINSVRAEAGLPPLQADPELVAIARVRSRDMAANRYLGHNPPDGCGYVCLMDRRGVSRSYAAETIAMNTYGWLDTAHVAVETWAGSPAHRSKMAGCHYERFGAAFAEAADGAKYLTTIYEGSGNC